MVRSIIGSDIQHLSDYWKVNLMMKQNVIWKVPQNYT